MKVSLLTPTTLQRLGFFKLLVKCVLLQDHREIHEWVVVGGDEDNKTLEKEMRLLFKNCPKLPPLVWVDSEKKAIGALRNEGNKHVSGDIIVCMDDDDYYPPQRVSHVVAMFQQHKNKHIAGCTAHYMYDVDTSTLFQWAGFGPNHCTNNTMAYRKQYLKTHKYDDTKRSGEEPTFLNNFKEPMIQLNPTKTIVQLSHLCNTFNKRNQIYSCIVHNQNGAIREVSKVNKIFPKDLQTRYSACSASISTSTPRYDIVYYLGTHYSKWEPTDTKIGGSEQAVIQLVSLWSAMGYKVGVYGEFEEGVVNGVAYHHWTHFVLSTPHKNVILWRLYGSFMLHFKFAAKRIFVDLHDNHCYKKLPYYKQFIHKVMVKSKFHKFIIDNHVHHKELTYHIVPNGIHDSFFVPDGSVQRQRFRFIYASCYKRGLEKILTELFPEIKKRIPQAELHIFYGMNLVTDEPFKARMRKLFQQPGVYEYGKQPLERILKEKKLADCHLYISKTTAETDCLSIKESAAVGCIPILSRYNVFSERPGIHLTDDVDMDELCTLLKDDFQMEHIRKTYKSSPDLLRWDYVAKEWVNNFVL